MSQTTLPPMLSNETIYQGTHIYGPDDAYTIRYEDRLVLYHCKLRGHCGEQTFDPALIRRRRCGHCNRDLNPLAVEAKLPEMLANEKTFEDQILGPESDYAIGNYGGGVCLYHIVASGGCGVKTTDPADIQARRCKHCDKLLNPLVKPDAMAVTVSGVIDATSISNGAFTADRIVITNPTVIVTPDAVERLAPASLGVGTLPEPPLSLRQDDPVVDGWEIVKRQKRAGADLHKFLTGPMGVGT